MPQPDQSSPVLTASQKEMRDQVIGEIKRSIAEGVPVVLTSGGRKVCTFYPDGKVARHDC
jgi:hypothetical protein